jgi:hypothetical protein
MMQLSRQESKSLKALSPEQSLNVNVDAGNQGSRFGAGSILLVGGSGVGLMWFSWRLAKHHVRSNKRRSTT